jgi:hypothetical protein
MTIPWWFTFHILRFQCEFIFDGCVMGTKIIISTKTINTSMKVLTNYNYIHSNIISTIHKNIEHQQGYKIWNCFNNMPFVTTKKEMKKALFKDCIKKLVLVWLKAIVCIEYRYLWAPSYSGTRSQKLLYNPLFKIDFLSSFMIILMDAKYYDKLISSNIDWKFMI